MLTKLYNINASNYFSGAPLELLFSVATDQDACNKRQQTLIPFLSLFLHHVAHSV